MALSMMEGCGLELDDLWTSLPTQTVLSWFYDFMLVLVLHICSKIRHFWCCYISNLGLIYYYWYACLGTDGLRRFYSKSFLSASLLNYPASSVIESWWCLLKPWNFVILTGPMPCFRLMLMLHKSILPYLFDSESWALTHQRQRLRFILHIC